jgi:hypothetical protein
MAKKKKTFKKFIDEHISINTKLREERKIVVDGVPTDVDTELLYRVGLAGYGQMERDNSPGFDFLIKSRLEELREYPIEENSWGFNRDWFFWWTGTTSKKPSQNTFEMDVPYRDNPTRSVTTKIPALWYALATYPDITIEMIDEMDREELVATDFNKNLGEGARIHLDYLMRKEKLK